MFPLHYSPRKKEKFKRKNDDLGGLNENNGIQYDIKPFIKDTERNGVSTENNSLVEEQFETLKLQTTDNEVNEEREYQ